ncbi:regulatory protein RecX [Bdellovibrio sp. HCB2-146]|uniref:regulatory protein RecX n=1 Tax=Bdellovibrio sp. HCB2-146 TaxID=3394362 RepID=UPI0039BD60C8
MSEEKKLGSSPRNLAKRKVMDLLSRRDHSEQELRIKLRDKFSEVEDSDNVIDEAIEFAKDSKWLGDPQELSYRMADMLHRRNKGIIYINNYLREKGLPAVETDRALELEKALTIVKNKYDENYEFSREEQARVGRLLASRGFDSETVRKVLYEKL